MDGCPTTNIPVDMPKLHTVYVEIFMGKKFSWVPFTHKNLSTTNNWNNENLLHVFPCEGEDGSAALFVANQRSSGLKRLTLFLTTIFS